MRADLLEKIKSRGYWRVNFQAFVYQQKLTSLGECRDIVEQHAVRLRGWDYPHFPHRSGDDTGLEIGEDYYEGWIDWEGHIEFWRMYQSGQFLHYRALGEDWFEQDSWFRSHAEQIQPMSSLNIIGSVVYQMTEVFEFLARLEKTGIYNEGVRVSVGLNNTKNRKLWISNGMRAPFLRDYITSSDRIDFVKECSRDQVVDSSKDIAMEAMIYILDRFGWHNPPIDTLKNDQNNLLTGRI